jgi:hypothetical protein
MSMRQVDGDVVLAGVLGAGANNSSAISFGPGVADVLALVHVTAVSGTTPSMIVTLQQSADGATGWATVVGSDSPAFTAAGNGVINARLTQPYARVVATVGGTATPTVTGRVAVMVFGE